MTLETCSLLINQEFPGWKQREVNHSWWCCFCILTWHDIVGWLQGAVPFGVPFISYNNKILKKKVWTYWLNREWIIQITTYMESLCLRGFLHHVDVFVQTFIKTHSNVLQIQFHVYLTWIEQKVILDVEIQHYISPSGSLSMECVDTFLMTLYFFPICSCFLSSLCSFCSSLQARNVCKS